MTEVSETKPVRIGLSDLPLSPRKAFKAATAMNWLISAWFSTAAIAPVLFTSSDPATGRSVGDLKSEGYTERLFVIEGRDPNLPIGFQAQYLGKDYEGARASVAGSFSSAVVIDPVGLPRELHAKYKAIPVHRGKFETEASYQNNLKRANLMAEQQNSDYNDHAIIFNNKRMFNKAGDFDAWLAEWKSFIPLFKKVSNA